MLASLRNLVRVADLRNKILFTILVIAIYQLGISIPIPGIDFTALHEHQQVGLVRGHPRLPEPVRRHRPFPRGRARARDHAVHHVVDHHPAAHRRDPEVHAVA